jgi:ABC-2 type transport system permease protein
VNAARVRAVVSKELLELRRNKAILWSMAILPVILVGTLLGSDAAIRREAARAAASDAADSAALDPAARAEKARERAKQEEEARSFLAPELRHLGADLGVAVQTNDMLLFTLLIIPLVLPGAIAAHSVVGEKETKSLEPLLATPVTTAELLLGKTLGAATPAVALGWLAYAAAAAGLWALGDPTVLAYALRPVWLLAVVALEPLLGVVATLLGVIVSSRVNDPRVAQQVAATVVLPVTGLSISVAMGKVYLGPGALAVGLALAAALAVVLLGLAVRLFQREAILTRWK